MAVTEYKLYKELMHSLVRYCENYLLFWLCAKKDHFSVNILSNFGAMLTLFLRIVFSLMLHFNTRLALVISFPDLSSFFCSGAKIISYRNVRQGPYKLRRALTTSLSFQLRHNTMSYVAPFPAELHPDVLRRTLTELRCTLLRSAAS